MYQKKKRLKRVATLIERVKLLHPPENGSDGSDEAQIQVENPFGSPHWHRANPDRF